MLEGTVKRDQFIKALAEQFPEAYALINQYERGLLHCEVGAFRLFIEQKMDEGALWYCEKAFRFIEQCLGQADSELQNAIEVSFIEDLAFGKQTARRYAVVKERAPRSLSNRMAQVDMFWK